MMYLMHYHLQVYVRLPEILYSLMQIKKKLLNAFTFGSISIILSSCVSGAKVKWPAYTNYVVDQTCRLTNPNFLTQEIAFSSVPLMLMDRNNPYYDLDAASELLLMTNDGVRPQSEQDEMIINIASGYIKKCPEKISKQELEATKGLVNYYKKKGVFCLRFADASYKKCIDEG